MRAAPANRGLFGVVAGLAEPLAVLLAGFTALGRAFGVVVVSDRGVAPGGAAELVAQSDQGAESVREAAGPCVGCDQRTGLGPHVQSLELRQSLFRGGLDELAGASSAGIGP